MKTRLSAAVLVTSALAFTLTCGCGQPKAATCLPGQAIACVGAAGCRGGQTCRADGLGYEACDCGSWTDAEATGGGAGGGVGGGTGGGTGGSVDAGVATEQEPNDGAGVGELDALSAPGAKSGTIGRANDVDIFMVTLTAGQQWRWRVDAHGSSLVPHLSVTEAQNTVPVLVARGSLGGVAEIEQLVLKTGSYAVIVRDSRNVPSSGSQGVGSAQHGYVVSGEASTRTPVLIAVPSTTAGGLTTRYATALHRFTLASLHRGHPAGPGDDQDAGVRPRHAPDAVQHHHQPVAGHQRRRLGHQHRLEAHRDTAGGQLPRGGGQRLRDGQRLELRAERHVAVVARVGA